MSSAEDISVDEALEKNSEKRNSCESSRQLLDCNHIVYRLFHCIVARALVYGNRWRCLKRRCS